MAEHIQAPSQMVVARFVTAGVVGDLDDELVASRLTPIDSSVAPAMIALATGTAKQRVSASPVFSATRHAPVSYEGTAVKSRRLLFAMRRNGWTISAMVARRSAEPDPSA